MQFEQLLTVMNTAVNRAPLPLPAPLPVTLAAEASPTAQTFIQDTLDMNGGRRHIVVRTASILNTSRADLANWNQFIDTLTAATDPVLERYVLRITTRAQ